VGEKDTEAAGMSEHTKAVDPETWAAQVEEVVRGLEQKPKRKRACR